MVFMSNYIGEKTISSEAGASKALSWMCPCAALLTDLFLCAVMAYSVLTTH